MNKSKLTLLVTALSTLLIGATISPTYFQTKADGVTVIDAGSPYDFRLNPGNPNDGFYFYLPENEAPYNSDYSVNYYPMNEYCIQLTRGGTTTDVCVVSASYPRDTVKKISPTEYYFRTIDGWTITSGFMPLQPYDKVTVSGSYYCGNYQLNLTAASFELDENGKIKTGKTVEEELTIVDEVRANNLEKTSSRGLYFQTEEHNLFYKSDWTVRYHAANNERNIALARDLSYTNFTDPSGDGYMVAYSDSGFYADLWIIGAYKFQDGDILHLNGSYFYTDSSTKTKYQFSLSNGVVLLNENSGVISASLLTDYGTYLFNKLVNRIDVDIYDGDSQKIIYEKFHEYKLFIEEERTFEECWNKYVDFVKYLQSLPQDETAKAAKIGSLRVNAINEITSLVDMSLYLEEQQTLIAEEMENAIAKIKIATSGTELDSIVKNFESFLASISTKEEIYSEDVLNNNQLGNASINDEHLENYDTVSLCDLGQDSEINLSTDPSLKQKNTDTDSEFDNNNANTFPVSKSNTTNSVSFKFKYAVNDEDMNLGVAIKLRGIKYCGFKFLLNDNNYGIYIKRTLKTEEDFLLGVSNTFKEVGEYLVELGAIDIEGTNKTFLFVLVNNSLVARTISEKMPYGLNRLDIHAEMSAYSLTIGSVTLKNYDFEPTYEAVHLGRFQVYENGEKTINLEAETNELPYSASKTINSYALRKDAIKLERNGEITSIANTDTAILHKYKENLYTFDMYSILDEYKEGDKIIIEGYFSSFDSSSSGKVAFYVSHTVLVYKNGKWENSSTTLGEAKEDALYKLNTYIDPDNYSEEDLLRVKTIIDEGKIEIEACTSIEEVNTKLASIISNADKVLTLIQQKRQTVISDIENYVVSIKDLYYDDEQAQLVELSHNYIALINASNSFDEIDALKNEFLEATASINTKEEKMIVALVEAKEDAIAKIRDTYGQCYIDSLSQSDIQEINNLVATSISEITNADSVEQVNQISQSVIDTLTNKFGLNKTASSVNYGLIIGLSAGGVILLVAIASIVIISKNKKKKINNKGE